MGNIDEVKVLVQDFFEECVAAGKQEGELPDYLRKALKGLERCSSSNYYCMPLFMLFVQLPCGCHQSAQSVSGETEA